MVLQAEGKKEKVTLKHIILITIILAILYVSSYFIYRSKHVEVWNKNGKAYVIFPKG
jgi:hypothetical protein